MTPTILEHVAGWVHDLTFEAIPAEVVDVARHAILDLVGVTIAADNDPILDVLTAYRGSGRGDCTVIAGPPADPELAAFLNGARGHALDWDDYHDTIGGHGTVVVFPAALAMAEATGASGSDLLTAHVAGMEVTSHLAAAHGRAQYTTGWHPTATFGVFGAAAAAAKVLGLDAEGITATLALAAATAAGTKAGFGTLTKPIQVGRAAQNGVFAARMVAAGATAHPAAIEAPQGYAAVFQGLDTLDVAAALGPIPWRLLTPGITIKRYPCCASTHSAIDAALALAATIHEPRDIVDVVVRAHPRRLPHVDRPHPASALAAKFSIQYATAAALVDGRVGPTTFDPAARTDIAELASGTTAEALPSDRDDFAAEVAVTMRDGSVIEQHLDRAAGSMLHTAAGRAATRTKFADCTSHLRGHDALAEAILGLGGSGDLGGLATLLASPTPR